MLFLKKLFKVPGPKELGRSKYDALPMRNFSHEEDDVYCWEDYDKEIGEKFPIKNFIINTLPDFIKYNLFYPFWVPYNTFIDYASSFIPGRRYHLLDLRQPYKEGDAVNFDCYRYGWCDVPEKMLYAMFNLLKEYLEEEPFDLTTMYSREQIEEDSVLKTQQAYLDEARLILHWWQIERKKEAANIDNLRHVWVSNSKNKETRENGAAHAAWQVLQEVEEAFENKTDEMCLRLLKIRRGLWT